MKKIIASAIFCLFPVASHADNIADMYFQGESPVLTEQEKIAIAISENWQYDNAGGIKPTVGKNGAVNYLFGASQPSIVCAPLQVCDVALEPGEQVNSIHPGDKVRWTIDPAITGFGPNQVTHLIIKPHDVGLDTTLVVTTNRRTYHFRLRSHRTEYMPRVTFTYPEAALEKWEAYKEKVAVAKERATLPETREYLGNLSFDYSISGNAPWKPLRVYNDGVKTIIQMPPAMQQTEAPTLLVLRETGGLFSDDQQVMVNYRVQGDRYIVDTVFDKAILITGVGDNQTRVTLEKGN